MYFFSLGNNFLGCKIWMMNVLVSFGLVIGLVSWNIKVLIYGYEWFLEGF